jgi:cytoskeletal protein RodZ
MPRIQTDANSRRRFGGAFRDFQMKKLPSDILTVGRGAEYVFRGKDTLIIVSGGKLLTLATRLAKDVSSLVLVDGNDAHSSSETVLFEGSASETMQAFLDLSSRLTLRKRRSALATIQSLSISAAAIAIVAALSLFVIETRPAAPQAEIEVSENRDELDQLPQLPQHPMSEQSTLPSVGVDPASLKVLRKPDFLSSENVSPTLPETVAKPTATEGKPTIADTVANIGLPFGRNKGTQAKAVELIEKDAKPGAIAAITPSSTTVATAEPVAENKDASTSAKPTTEAEKLQPKAADAKALEKDDPAIGKNAQATVSKLIGNGMTEDQIRKLLMDLQTLKNTGGEDGITPEMLQSLPEEVAALLADQGMDLEGPGGGTMNILPSEVVDRFRGNDGVATIPENYSWYARSGGPVAIPLPGGGDIKHPDDLKDFGLQP